MNGDLRRAQPISARRAAAPAVRLVLAVTIAAAPARARGAPAPPADAPTSQTAAIAASGAEAANPAEAAFVRARALLDEHCGVLRAAYDDGDRRPPLLLALADCHLIEADVWRAAALRDDADRLAASAVLVPNAPATLDLEAQAELWRASCREFEQSLSLEPSVGAQLAVALCRIRAGTLASSRELLSGMLPQLTALAAAKDPFHVGRLALAQALLAEIDRVQPRVTLQVREAARGAGDEDPAGRAAAPPLGASVAGALDDPDLSLTIDGKRVPARVTQPLDAGRYQVSARSGAASADTVLVLAPHTRYQLTLEVVPPSSSRRWRLAAGALAGVGVVAAVGGGVAWWHSERALDDLEAAGGVERPEGFDCPNAECRDLADTVNRDRTLRGVAFAAAGLAAASAVVVLLMTPPERPTELRWLPAAHGDAVTLDLRGGF